MRQKWQYRGFRLTRVGEPRYPWYAIVNEDGNEVEQISFPSMFCDEVDRIIYQRKLVECPKDAAQEFRNQMWDWGKRKQYSGHDVNRHMLDKVFNRGQGRVEAMAVYPQHDIILVNDAVWNQHDQRHLDALLVKLECKDDYEIKHVQYGYPEYYNHNFGLGLLSA